MTGQSRQALLSGGSRWGGRGLPLTGRLPLDTLADEGLWDILIKDIPKEVTSYTFSMDILKPGVSYDFRVIAVNDYGFGTPSSPSQSVPGTAHAPEDWTRAWVSFELRWLCIPGVPLQGFQKPWGGGSVGLVNTSLGPR